MHPQSAGDTKLCGTINTIRFAATSLHRLQAFTEKLSQYISFIFIVFPNHLLAAPLRDKIIIPSVDKNNQIKDNFFSSTQSVIGL